MDPTRLYMPCPVLNQLAQIFVSVDELLARSANGHTVGWEAGVCVV